VAILNTKVIIIKKVYLSMVDCWHGFIYVNIV